MTLPFCVAEPDRACMCAGPLQAGQHAKHARHVRADIVMHFPDRGCIAEGKYWQSVAKALAQIDERPYALAEMGQGYPVVGVDLNCMDRKAMEMGHVTLYDPDPKDPPVTIRPETGSLCRRRALWSDNG